MNIPTSLKTNRLLIETITTNDSLFILELMNTDGWIRFIGDRNITSEAEATAYIQNRIDNPNVTYWVVKIDSDQTKIGIVSFIKQDYLEYHDIGFAFLPAFASNGYAYEAAHAVLNEITQHSDLTHICAATDPENFSSIKLLNKLGLSFEKEITVENETLHVYNVSTAKLKNKENTK